MPKRKYATPEEARTAHLAQMARWWHENGAKWELRRIVQRLNLGARSRFTVGELHTMGVRYSHENAKWYLGEPGKEDSSPRAEGALPPTRKCVEERRGATAGFVASVASLAGASPC